MDFEGEDGLVAAGLRGVVPTLFGILLLSTLSLFIFLEPTEIMAKATGLGQAWHGKVFGKYFFNLEFWLVIALTLTLEQLLPAVPRQRSFSLSFFQDLVWFLYEAAITAIITGTYVLWLKGYYARHFDGFTITALIDLPLWLRFAIGVLLLDFLYLLHHLPHHHIPLPLPLHAIHH